MKRQKIHILIPVTEIENISNDLKSNERLVRILITRQKTQYRNEMFEKRCGHLIIILILQKIDIDMIGMVLL